jgi:prevent-host-death family protein
MDVITVSEAKATLSRLVRRALDGEAVVIGRRGEPQVVLVAYAPDQTPRTLGFATSDEYWMSEDFDAPLDDVEVAFDPDAASR